MIPNRCGRAHYRVPHDAETLPPVVQEDGSTASTDTLCPRPVRILPTTSMNDDFPAPGGPERPLKIVNKNTNVSFYIQIFFFFISYLFRYYISFTVHTPTLKATGFPPLRFSCSLLKARTLCSNAWASSFFRGCCVSTSVMDSAREAR